MSKQSCQAQPQKIQAKHVTATPTYLEHRLVANSPEMNRRCMGLANVPCGPWNRNAKLLNIEFDAIGNTALQKETMLSAIMLTL